MKTTGLVLGKFMPLHKGHIELIKFGAKHCDLLYVLICVSNKELISASVRLNWLIDSFVDGINIKPIILNYDEEKLTNTSISSFEVSKEWAKKIESILPKLDYIFSSEKYGDYLAEIMSIKHIVFDISRSESNISSTQIRNNPFKYWNFLVDAAKPFYVKKIILLGTESTGKSMVTERLANYFNTTYVQEMARNILQETINCTSEDLQKIASLHATTINEKVKVANKLLFIDTDVNITKSYSLFLFQKELIVPLWIEEANKSDLYFFLESDCPFIQDGTRLEEEERNKLSLHHKKILTDLGINYVSVIGNWDERFCVIKTYIEQKYFTD
jgi:HTH-type transcriptional regulator, transcriptional repressor of NAD biosynthesis genes